MVVSDYRCPPLNDRPASNILISVPNMFADGSFCTCQCCTQKPDSDVSEYGIKWFAGSRYVVLPDFSLIRLIILIYWIVLLNRRIIVGVQEIVEALCYNTSLTHFDISNNGITSSAMSGLLKKYKFDTLSDGPSFRIVYDFDEITLFCQPL